MKKIIITFVLIICLIWFIFHTFWTYRFQKIIEALYDTWSYPIVEVLLKEEDETAKNLHNAGNSMYRQYEENKENIRLLEESIDYFSWSLDIEENIDTRYNYVFTKKILDEIEKQEEEKEEQNKQEKEEQNKQEEDTEQNQDTENKEDWDGETSSWKSEKGSSQEDTENTQKNNREEQYKLEQQQEVWKLSKEETQALEKIIENLKKEQIYNQKFYNKKDQKTFWEKMFDDFFDRGWEKDW